MYRGIDKQTGKVVKGWLIKHYREHRIMQEFTYHEPVWADVISESVAMDTGLKDKNGTPIYGSIILGGKMTRGGDRFRGKESGLIFTVEYVDGGFILTKIVERSPYPVKHCDLSYAMSNLDLEIIGTQWEGVETDE